MSLFVALDLQNFVELQKQLATQKATSKSRKQFLSVSVDKYT